MIHSTDVPLLRSLGLHLGYLFYRRSAPTELRVTFGVSVLQTFRSYGAINAPIGASCL
jgi:hypothetical protein